MILIALCLFGMLAWALGWLKLIKKKQKTNTETFLFATRTLIGIDCSTWPKSRGPKTIHWRNYKDSLDFKRLWIGSQCII